MAKKEQTDKFRELRSKAEKKLRYEKIPVSPKDETDFLKTIHELHVHQTELEMRNEQLRQAQQELEESRNKYCDLFDFAPVGYFTLDKRGLVIEANLTGCQMLDTERKNVLKKPFSIFVDRSSQDRFYLHRQDVLNIIVRQSCRITLVRKDGETFEARLDSTPILNDGEHVIGARVTVIDITERKQADVALRASQQSLALAQAIAHLGNWSWDIKTNKQEWSDESFRIFGFEPGECQPDYDLYVGLLHPEDRRRLLACLRDVLERNTPFHIDYRILRRDGSVRYVHSEGQIVRDDDGQPLRVFGINQDITERMRVEQELSESRNKYQALIENTADFIWEMDASGKYTYCSPQMKDLWGYEPKDMIGKTPFDVMPPEDRKEAIESFMALARSPKPFTGLEAPSYDRQGRLIAVEISGVPFFDADGRLLGYRGISRDVTERKRAEQAMAAAKTAAEAAAEAKSRFLAVVDSTSDGVVILSAVRDPGGAIVDFRYEYINEAGALLNERPVAEHLGKTVLELLPAHEGTELWDEYIRVTEQGGTVTKESLLYEDVYGGGQRLQRAFDIRASKLDDGLAVLWRDVTPRYRAEEALRESEERYRTLFESSPDGIVFTDMGGRILRTNPYYRQMLGYSEEELYALTYQQLTPQRWHEMEAAIVRDKIMSRGSSGVYEKEYIRKDGTVFPVSIQIWLIRDAHGEPQGMWGIVRDITERKKAEAALRDSEEKFRLLAETSPAAIIIYQDGKYVYVNPAAESVTGYTSAELLAQVPGDIVQPDYYEQVKQMISRREHGEGLPVHYELKIHTKDGRERWMDCGTVSIRYGKKPAGLVLAFDITERKRVEEELRESERHWHSLAEALPQLVWTCAPDGRCDFLSQQWITYTGRSEAEQLVYGWLDQVHPDDHDRLKAEWDEAVASATLFDVEFRIRRADGVYRWFKTRAVPIRDADGQVTKWFGSNTDIEDLRGTTEALRRSQQRLKLAQTSSGAGVWDWDITNGKLEWSEELFNLFGLDQTVVDASFEVWQKITHPEDRQAASDRIKSAIQSHQQLNSESRMILPSGEIRWINALGSTVYDEQGNAVRMTGICIDITERKQAEEKINNLARFPEENPFPVLRLRDDGTIAYSNKPGLLLVEQWKAKVGRKAPKKWRQLAKKAVQSGRYLVEEIKCSEKIFSIAVAPVLDGRYVNLYGRDITTQRKVEKALRKSRDDLEMQVKRRTAQLEETVNSLLFEISERKRAEKSLKEKTRDLDAFFSHTITPLVILDKDFNFIRVNKAYADSCQRDISEFVGHNHFEFYPDEEVEKIFQETVRSRKPFATAARPFSFPDHPEWGVTYWDWTLVPVLNNEQEVELLIFSLNDVTKSKRAEMAMADSEKKYRTLIEVSPESVIVVVEEKLAFVNSAAVKIIKAKSHEELVGRSVWDFVHPDSLEQAKNDIREILENNSKLPPRGFKLICLDGSTIDIEATGTAIVHQHKRGLLLIYHDITDRKRAEGRTQATNALLELFAKKTSRKEYLDEVAGVLRDWSGCRYVGIRLASANGYIPFESHIGLSREFLELENTFCLNQDDCVCTRIISQMPYSVDAKLMTPKGSFHCGNSFGFLESLSEKEKQRYRGNCLKAGFASLAIIPIRYGENILGAIYLADKRTNMVPLETVSFLEGIAVMIGEAIQRFNIEESLRLSEWRLSEAQRIAHMGNWEWNVETSEVWWSEEVYHIFDVSTEQFKATYKSFLLLIHPEDQMFVEEAIKEALRRENEFSIDFRIIRPDGSERNVHEEAEVILDKKGKAVKMTGIIQDVTDRIKAEEAAKQSEEKFLLMARSSDDVFWISTPGIGKIVYISPAYEKLWGRTRSSIYKKATSFIDAIHPEDKEKVKNGLKGPIRGSREFIYRIIRPDGSVRWVHNKSYPLLNEKGKLYLMAGTVRDITEIKEAETKILEHQKELRSLTAELQLAEERERRQIAQDLHDSLGQILSFSSMELKSLQKSASEPGNHSIDEISNQLDEAVKQVRTLSFDLSPSILYDLGFEVAIEDLTEKFSKERKLDCHFENCRKPKPLAEHISIFLYRSVRELLINVAKHAKADIVIVSLLRKGNDLYITVTDDGVGLEIEELLEGSKPKGFGLFNIRERLEHIGGRFAIESTMGKGTKVTLIAPLEVNG